MQTPRAFLEKLIEYAISETQPKRILSKILPQKPTQGRSIVLALGKAAPQMAATIDKIWESPFEGIMLGLDDQDDQDLCKTLKNFKILRASHPFSNLKGIEASEYIIKRLCNLAKDDHVFVFLSGGASALLAGLPPNGCLETVNDTVQKMMNQGANIFQLNMFRRVYSNIRGGRLAQICAPANVTTFAISDVPGDDPLYIASGPTHASPIEYEDLKKLLLQFNIEPMAELKEACNLTPASLSNIATTKIILKPMDALNAMEEVAQKYFARTRFNHPLHAPKKPLEIINLGDLIEGDVISVAQNLIAIARTCLLHHKPCTPPCLILSGGETTVKITTPHGKGGPNSTLALACSDLIKPHEPIYLISVDSDGKDGNTGMGGYTDASTKVILQSQNINIKYEIATNNAYNTLLKANSAIESKSTFTNVNDLRAILILDQKPQSMD
ncbi:MAG: DUF4147 domain-containing protein [Pseudomonadota bacterium]